MKKNILLSTLALFVFIAGCGSPKLIIEQPLKAGRDLSISSPNMEIKTPLKAGRDLTINNH